MIIYVKSSAKLRLRLIKKPSELQSIQTDSSNKWLNFLWFQPVHCCHSTVYDHAFPVHERESCAVHQFDSAIGHHSRAVGHCHISFHDDHVATFYEHHFAIFHHKHIGAHVYDSRFLSLCFPGLRSTISMMENESFSAML